MKKNVIKHVLSLLVVLGVAVTSCFGYINVDSKVIYKDFPENKVSNVEPVAKEEEKEAQEVVEEAPVVEEEKVVNQNDALENASEPVVENIQEKVGNSIRIDGILNKNLMKDETGEHFYLNHNINGVYDGVGVPYIDFRNDLTGRKTIIYSHSSKSGNGPFQVLQNYHNNYGFYQNHRYITVQYNGVEHQYEIFSVYVSTADSEQSEGLEYFHRMDYSDSEWEYRINWYKNNSEYDTGVSVSASDKILILQTCCMDPNYYEQYYRYNLVIMAKLIY